MKRTIQLLIPLALSILPACSANEHSASLAGLESLSVHAEAHQRAVDVYFDQGQFSAPCPVFHAHATLNGHPMQLVDPGGYSQSAFGGGRCARPKFSLTVPDQEGDADAEIRIEDETAVVVLRAQHLLSTPTLALDAPRDHVLRSVYPATLRISPAELAVVAPFRVQYVPAGGPEGSSPRALGFVVTDADLGTHWSPGEISFTVLSDDSVPSSGALLLDKDADYFRLRAPIVSCEGAVQCSADLLFDLTDSPRTSASYEPAR